MQRNSSFFLLLKFFNCNLQHKRNWTSSYLQFIWNLRFENASKQLIFPPVQVLKSTLQHTCIWTSFYPQFQWNFRYKNAKKQLILPPIQVFQLYVTTQTHLNSNSSPISMKFKIRKSKETTNSSSCSSSYILNCSKNAYELQFISNSYEI